MPAIGVSGIVSLVGAGLGAIGSLAQASSASAAYAYQAKVAEANAQTIRQRTQFEETRLREQQRRFMASQRAAFAKAGVALEEGSPLAVLAETAAQAEMDVQALRYEGATAAAAERANAGAYRMRAGSATTGGYFGAAGSLLSYDWAQHWQTPVAATPRPRVAGYGTPRMGDLY